MEVRLNTGDADWVRYTKIRYANSSIPLLAEFMVLLENTAKWYSDNMPSTYDEQSSHKWSAIVEELSKRFECLDPRTIQGVDAENFIYTYWWTVIMDIGQYGLG